MWALFGFLFACFFKELTINIRIFLRCDYIAEILFMKKYGTKEIVFLSRNDLFLTLLSENRHSNKDNKKTPKYIQILPKTLDEIAFINLLGISDYFYRIVQEYTENCFVELLFSYSDQLFLILCLTCLFCKS